MKIYTVLPTMTAIEGWTSDEVANALLQAKGINSYEWIGGSPDSAMYYKHPIVKK
jgi:hypothetical protein